MTKKLLRAAWVGDASQLVPKYDSTTSDDSNRNHYEANKMFTRGCICICQARGKCHFRKESAEPFLSWLEGVLDTQLLWTLLISKSDRSLMIKSKPIQRTSMVFSLKPQRRIGILKWWTRGETGGSSRAMVKVAPTSSHSRQPQDQDNFWRLFYGKEAENMTPGYMGVFAVLWCPPFYPKYHEVHHTQLHRTSVAHCIKREEMFTHGERSCREGTVIVGGDREYVK